MPAVELDDGRWMSDTTPIIGFLDREFPESPVIPSDPVLRFVALLIEDYADEWLWRPAMHYRWSYAHDRELLSSIIVDELLGHVPLPRFLKRRIIQLRQRRGFVIGDGVTSATWHHVELGYFAALENMTAMLGDRPFLFGNAPTIADFGLMGPMFRHFGQDPTPAELMRERAPGVYEWVARVWHAKAPGDGALPCMNGIPGDAQPMLQEVCETHLAQLVQNARAFVVGARRFDAVIQGCAYSRIPVSRYRVWCLERLRGAFSALTADQQNEVRSHLQSPEAEILWKGDLGVRSRYDESEQAPFNRAINVYGKGVPR